MFPPTTWLTANRLSFVHLYQATARSGKRRGAVFLGSGLWKPAEAPRVASGAAAGIAICLVLRENTMTSEQGWEVELAANPAGVVRLSYE